MVRVRRVGDLRVGADEERREHRDEDQEGDECSADQEARLAANITPTEEPPLLRCDAQRDTRRGDDGIVDRITVSANL